MATTLAATGATMDAREWRTWPSALRPRAADELTRLRLHDEAERCLSDCVRDAANDPRILYNWASALTAVGRLEDAEAAYDRVIALAPGDADAYYNRATLRRQTQVRNHIPEIEARLRATAAGEPAMIALSYALAKELEDVGEYSQSFAALRRGADARRARLSYRVADDIDTMAQIEHHFGPTPIERRRRGHADRRMVFVFGLPRSGTTLVDRILSSHSGVRSRGESSDLALAVTRCAGVARSKPELIRAAALIEPERLGVEYCSRVDGDAAVRVVDKTPSNFLYLGLIATALPDAVLIHVRRNCRDVCYAMYKTLFRMAYPFSYDLTDLARYYAAYARLMAHWRSVLGDRITEVDYETLVGDPDTESRRLIRACGIDWEIGCADFHRNPAPSLTASAGQVRLPIYTSSVGLWRRYARELEPLIETLRLAGVEFE
jgi:tetratricopeptide (TPR) repeat protein